MQGSREQFESRLAAETGAAQPHTQAGWRALILNTLILCEENFRAYAWAILRREPSTEVINAFERVTDAILEGRVSFERPLDHYITKAVRNACISANTGVAEVPWPLDWKGDMVDLCPGYRNDARRVTRPEFQDDENDFSPPPRRSRGTINQPDEYEEELTLRAMRYVLVKGLLDRLSDSDRKLVVMRDAWGMQIAQIAELTGLSQNAVRLRLADAKKRLRKIVASVRSRRPAGD